MRSRWTRSWLPYVVALSGCAAALAACGKPPPVPVALPHHNFPDVAVSGVATGGVIRFDGHCAWLESESGSSNLIWPTDFHATAPPLAIYGHSGLAILH